MAGLAQRLRQKALSEGGPGPAFYFGISSPEDWQEQVDAARSFRLAPTPRALGRYTFVDASDRVILCDVVDGTVYDIPKEGGYMSCDMDDGSTFRITNGHASAGCVVFTEYAPPRVVHVPPLATHALWKGFQRLSSSSVAVFCDDLLTLKVYPDGRTEHYQIDLYTSDLPGYFYSEKSCSATGAEYACGRKRVGGDLCVRAIDGGGKITGRCINIPREFPNYHYGLGEFINDEELLVYATSPSTAGGGPARKIIVVNVARGTHRTLDSADPPVYQVRVTHRAGTYLAECFRPDTAQVYRGKYRATLEAPFPGALRAARISADTSCVLLGDVEIAVDPSLTPSLLLRRGAARRLLGVLGAALASPPRPVFDEVLRLPPG